MEINYLDRFQFRKERPNREPESERWRGPAVLCGTVFGHIVDALQTCAQSTHKVRRRMHQPTSNQTRDEGCLLTRGDLGEDVALDSADRGRDARQRASLPRYQVCR